MLLDYRIFPHPSILLQCFPPYDLYPHCNNHSNDIHDFDLLIPTWRETRDTSTHLSSSAHDHASRHLLKPTPRLLNQRANALVDIPRPAPPTWILHTHTTRKTISALARQDGSLRSSL